MDHLVGGVGITTIGIRANDSPSDLELAFQEFDSKLEKKFDQITQMLENMLLHLQRRNGVVDLHQKLEKQGTSAAVHIDGQIENEMGSNYLELVCSKLGSDITNCYDEDSDTQSYEIESYIAIDPELDRDRKMYYDGLFDSKAVTAPGIDIVNPLSKLNVLMLDGYFPNSWILENNSSCYNVKTCGSDSDGIICMDDVGKELFNCMIVKEKENCSNWGSLVAMSLINWNVDVENMGTLLLCEFGMIELDWWVKGECYCNPKPSENKFTYEGYDPGGEIAIVAFGEVINQGALTVGFRDRYEEVSRFSMALIWGFVGELKKFIVKMESMAMELHIFVSIIDAMKELDASSNGKLISMFGGIIGQEFMKPFDPGDLRILNRCNKYPVEAKAQCVFIVNIFLEKYGYAKFFRFSGKVRDKSSQIISAGLKIGYQIREDAQAFQQNPCFIINIENDNGIQVWNQKRRSGTCNWQWKSNVTVSSVIRWSSFMLVCNEYGLVSVLKYDPGSEHFLQVHYELSSQILAEATEVSISYLQPLVGFCLQPCSFGNKILIACESGLLIFWDLVVAHVVHSNKVLEFKHKVVSLNGGITNIIDDAPFHGLERKKVSGLCWQSTDGAFEVANFHVYSESVLHIGSSMMKIDRLYIGDEYSCFSVNPVEVAHVSFKTCWGMVEECKFVEYFHWVVKPKTIAKDIHVGSSMASGVTLLHYSKLQGMVNSRDDLDRFIPNRSAIDYDYAVTMLTSIKGNSNPNPKPNVCVSLNRGTYRKMLADAFDMDTSRRILAFKNKVTRIRNEFVGDQRVEYSKPCRFIPQMSETVLYAPNLMDNFCLNLLDWGNTNVISIALGDRVYLRDASDGAISNLVIVDEESGPVTSVRWAPDGRHIAVGLYNSEVQLWDVAANRMLRSLRGGHRSGVGAMDWKNGGVLTTGGMDSRIINNDVRVGSHIVGTYRGHHRKVCGLKWSELGHQLASGGGDNLVHIWDRRNSTKAPRQWLHRLEEHTAAVRALAWSLFQANFLASGGGNRDGCLKFWDTHSGACLNTVDTSSQICGLLWNKNEQELLSSHGYTDNQTTLWKYPSMVKIAELKEHTSRVLFMAQSPDGCTVASAGDESLRFWNVFVDPKHAPKTSSEPFPHFNHIR